MLLSGIWGGYMLPRTHGQELKLRAGRVSGRIGLWYDAYGKHFFKIEPQALYNDQICFINLIFSFLFSLQVFLP